MLVQKKINMMASRRNRCATPKDIFSHTDPTWVDITGRAEAEAGISHTAPPYATATATTTLVTNYSAVGSTWERFLPLTQLPYPSPHNRNHHVIYVSWPHFQRASRNGRTRICGSNIKILLMFCRVTTWTLQQTGQTVMCWVRIDGGVNLDDL